MGFLEEMRTRLLTISPAVGTVVIGRMPASPDQVVVIRETGGVGPNLGFSAPGVDLEQPGVQIRVRGEKNKVSEPRTVIERIYQNLAQVQGTQLSGTEYHLCKPQQSPFELERDENERVVFAVNFLCEKEPSSV